uniref:Exodeoxyribonuclease III n=1 Tax=Candidatus Aschnera chinzeii TaxID=1485666 RepID=A0AAT9G4U9_9ENTR|nr:MAG: exodeoxyribonuclease III [Candidatus Aschnera chinzeii]
MKCISFNINGIRAHLHQLEEIINKDYPDIIGLQETKVDDPIFPLAHINHLGYNVYYHGQKAHYGVALLLKSKAISIDKGFPNDIYHAQRRIITAHINTKIGIIIIINLYVPQGGYRKDPIKFPAKIKFFHNLYNYLYNYKQLYNNIIIMGDINISPTDNDIGIGNVNKQRWLNIGKCSFLPEERELIKKIQSLGFTDIYRYQNPDVKNKFSWFDYRSNGFSKNNGLRIDLMFVSNKMLKYCVNSGIDYHIRSMNKPSDHAPIWTTFNF